MLKMTRLEQCMYDRRNRTPLVEALSFKEKVHAVRTEGFNRITAMASENYGGKNYIPLAVLNEIIDRTDPQLHHRIAVFDHITRSILDLLGCKDVTLFDRGDGFLATSMKFDIIIGNPPYQTGNQETGGANSLWRKFVAKAFDVCEPDGYVAMVCPGFPVKAKDLRQHFLDNTPVMLNNDVSHLFPTVSINIKYWVVRKGKHHIQFVVDGTPWDHDLELDPTKDRRLVSILTKIRAIAPEDFQCKHDRGYVSSQLKHDQTDYFEEPTGDSIHPIRHASRIKVCYVKNPTRCHTLRKVMMTYSGHPNFEYYDETTPMSSCYEMSGYIEVRDRTEGESLINLYNTKLYRLLSKGNSAGMKGEDSYSLPRVDLARRWTDQDLYQHFGLTPEEIDHVESTVG